MSHSKQARAIQEAYDQRRTYNLSPEEAATATGTNIETGLTGAEAAGRLSRFGRNELQGEKPTSALAIFMAQFKSFMIWVLVGAALVSGFLGEWVDALAIVCIVALNAVLGFIQEHRAEKSLAALKRMASPTSKVIRNGQHVVVPAGEIVPGDLVELEAGDHVPADSRIMWLTSNFSAQEASLTGESTPVAKTRRALDEREVPLADRANMVYMGTSVASGKARVMVVETGMATELGRIAGMIQDIKHETTPLQRKLEGFGKWIVYVCFVLVAVVFLLEWLRGGKVMEVFLTAVSLAVAAIPEGLPAVVTIALALGVQRMVKRHALIRKLPSVETLGCATVICSDKTGTLTKNEMTVQRLLAGGEIFEVTGIGYEPKGDILLGSNAVEVGGHPELRKALECAVLCNGAALARDGETYKICGDPTEAALLTAAGKAGIWKQAMEAEFEFVDEIPFDSERKKMSVIRRRAGSLVSFVKGAPDVLVADCDYIETQGAVRPITAADREAVLKANGGFADRALRVLGLAYKPIDEMPVGRDLAKAETGLVFVGLAAMIDPPRPEVKQAVAQCKTAGIRTVMITGDHKNTAVAVGTELGFFKEGSVALASEELDALSDEDLASRIEQVPVYARVSPEHKLRIVKAWRGKGHVVAMTGDGVNDAPAVKEADIGVAMGITGTDVTKEVSDMVVTDDNFASIVSAVEEGRGIYDNIKKFVHYLLSCNAGEVLVMFMAAMVGLPVPLLPIQILWVNLVTDGLPALALGVDPVDRNIMKRKPRRTDEGIVGRSNLVLMVVQGAVIATGCLLAFCYVYYFEGRHSLGQFFQALLSMDTTRLGNIFTVDDATRELVLARARTVAFVVLAFSQDFHSYNCRNQRESLFKIGIFSNHKLVAATMVSMTLNAMAIYNPFFQTFLKTQPLLVQELLLVVGFASMPLWVMEAVKLWARRTNHLDLLPV
ncbi:MAG: cation-translocating P-type ATPase [bacterium]